LQLCQKTWLAAQRLASEPMQKKVKTASQP
jgi:hypothetical protein